MGKSKTYKPGVYPDLSFEEYCAIDAINASLLKKASESLQAAAWYLQYGSEQTAAMRVGSVTHTAILEPDEIETRYCIAEQCSAEKKDGDQCSRNGSVCRGGAWYCNQHDPGEGQEDTRTAITEAEWNVAKWIKRRVMDHDELASLIARKGQSEVTLVWTDPLFGVPMKARLDRWIPELGLVVDIKTTTCARPEAFARSMERFGYFIQAAHYLIGLHELGERAETFQIAAVEKGPPHHLAMPRISWGGRAFEYGVGQRHEAMSGLIEAMNGGRWTGYASETPYEIDPPEAASLIEEESDVF